MAIISAEEIDAMSVDERLELLERVSASLENEDIPLTEAQRVEIERRLELDKRGELPYRLWEEVRRELEDRYP